MTGVEIAGEVLGSYAPFLALIPVANFDYWELPQGTGVPSVLLTKISRVERQFLAEQSFVMVTERVQATVRANSAAQRAAILDTIRNAWRDKRPTIAGVTAVSTLLAGDGPDFKEEDAAIYMGSTDARVSFTAPS